MGLRRLRGKRRIGALALALVLLAAACSDPDDGQSAEAEISTEDGGPGSTATTLRTIETDEEAPPAFVDLPLEEKIEAFLERPGAALASNLAAEMALDGDPRWAPWLIDLLRLGAANGSDEQVAGALSILSGVEQLDGGSVIDDYRIYGQWVYDEAIDPGPGYREWKRILYSPIDEDYAGFFVSITDDVLLARIQWGGESRGGIPELNGPERVSAADAVWMLDDEIVFGAVVDDIAVAYPFRILGHHELANDTIGQTPVSLVFCTLCRTALLFDRRVADDGGELVVDFQTSGLLVNSNKIMVDNQTDTLWSHLEAVGLGGPLEGVELDQYPLETTTWGEWIAAHPTSEVLAIPDPIIPDDPDEEPIDYEYEPDSAYQLYYDDPDVWFPILDTPTEDIDLKESVIGLDFGGEQLAIAVDAIAAEGPRVFVVGGNPVLVVPNSAGARIYDGAGTDLVEGDRPDVTVDGEQVVLADGTTLNRSAASQGLWFAWFGNNPSTDWWPRA